MPSINKDTLAEIFKEASRDRRVRFGVRHDFTQIEKLFLSGKENLQVFLGILRTTKSVRIDFHHTWFTIDDNCSWDCERFPQGLWNQIASFIPVLIVDNVDNNIFMPMISQMEHSQRLRKLEVKCDISEEAWRYLLNTSVDEVIAPLRTWISINPTAAVKDSPIKSVGVSVEYSDQIGDDGANVVQYFDFFNTFDAPAKNLNMKVGLRDTWNDFLIGLTTDHQSRHVENLNVEFNEAYDIPMIANVGLTGLLEHFQRVFPNLKEVNMSVKTIDGENFFGPFVPHSEFATATIKELTNQVTKAIIAYKLYLNWIRVDTIKWDIDDVSDFCNTLEALEFNCEASEEYQEWMKETELGDNKIFKLEFHLQGEQHREMMDDLGLNDDEEDVYYGYDNDEYAYDDDADNFDDYQDFEY